MNVRLPLAAALFSTVLLAPAHAASDTPLRLVVPFPPGDGLETAARVLADRAATELGRSIVVENRPGASGAIAAEAVARSDDGVTFLLGTTAMMTITPYLKTTPYAPADFKPVARAATIAPIFTVRPDLPVSDWKEFVWLAKKNPGKYTYGSPGEGTSIHMGMEVLQKAAGIQVLQVPYKGMGPALQDFLGGRIDIYTEPAIIAHVQAGKAKALMTMGEKRLPELPDVPTAEELGVEMKLQPWIGVFAPKAAPDELVQRLEQAMSRAVSDPAFATKLPPGVQPSFLAAMPFGAQIQEEQRVFGGLIDELGLKSR